MIGKKAIIFLAIIHLVEFKFVNSQNENISYDETRTWRIYMEDEGEQVVGYISEPADLNDVLSLSYDEVRRNCIFTLYTRLEPEGTSIFDPESLKTTTFDANKKTKFITHGWMSGGKQDTCIQIKNGFLQNDECNVIILDWSSIAKSKNYFKVAFAVERVAQHYYNFIKYTVESLGANTKDIHLIGHSLGAHVSGLAGKMFNYNKLARVTGLDPALPLFGYILLSDIIWNLPAILGRSIWFEGISRDSADFVDVIHTCSGFLGVKDAIAHADFYPNGGSLPQPGCQIQLKEYCSHGRSWRYFAESLLFPEEPFFAFSCDSYSKFKEMECHKNNITRMGDPVSTSARGSFYLDTKTEEPFSLGFKALFSDLEDNFLKT